MRKLPGRADRLSGLLSLAFVAALAQFLAAGSCVETDIGAPCMLVKTSVDRSKSTSAGAPCADLEVNEDNLRAEPQCFRPNLTSLEQGQGKDFISFGATECENLTCVRSAGEELPGDETSPNGYCSGECITDEDCESEAGGFVCRALVLDDEFLNGLKETLTEEEYQRYFGRIQNAKFCAKAE